MVNYADWSQYGCPYCRRQESLAGISRGTVYSVVRCSGCRKLFAILFSPDYMKVQHFSGQGTIDLLVREDDGDKVRVFNYEDLVQAAERFQSIVAQFRDREFVLQKHPQPEKVKRR